MTDAKDSLDPRQAHLWFCPPDSTVAGESLCRWERLLGPDERDRAARFRLGSDRGAYVAAHALIRFAVGARLGVQADAIELVAVPGRAPELRGRHGSGRIRLSLSHARGLVACAVAVDVPVGADVERVHHGSEIDELVPVVLSPAERSAFSRLPADARAERFFALWTLKESYLKALGIGLAGGADAPSLTEISFDVEAREIALALGSPGAAEEAGWRFATIRPLGDWIVSAAVGRLEGSRVEIVSQPVSSASLA